MGFNYKIFNTYKQNSKYSPKDIILDDYNNFKCVPFKIIILYKNNYYIIILLYLYNII
jgi:hypothetical protein